MAMAGAGFGKPFVNCQQALSKLINSLLFVNTSLKYSEGWDSPWPVGIGADVVVRFEETPGEFVFWKGQTISLILSLSVVSGLAMELMREGTSMAAA